MLDLNQHSFSVPMEASLRAKGGFKGASHDLVGQTCHSTWRKIHDGCIGGTNGDKLGVNTKLRHYLKNIRVHIRILLNDWR